MAPRAVHPQQLAIAVTRHCCPSLLPPPRPLKGREILASPSRVRAAVCCMLKFRPPGLKSVVGCMWQAEHSTGREQTCAVLA